MKYYLSGPSSTQYDWVYCLKMCECEHYLGVPTNCIDFNW